VGRRVSRLRTEPPDRQPVLIVGALVIGLVGGLVMVPRLFSGMDGRAENYVLLASSLYAQGENPAVLRERLTSVGVTQPASTVLGLAQRYASSRDRKQQHQAEALEAFGKVLLNPDNPPPSGASPNATGAMAASAPPAPSAVPTVGLTPLGTAASRPAGASTPAPGASPAPPTPSPVVANALLTPAPAAATPGAAGSAAPSAAQPPAATPGVVQRGRVRPADGGSARLRKEPNQTGGTLAVIPFAAQVEILETVKGQALEGESRWLRVRYGNLVGYLWGNLVVIGD
jgi:hypothetical protein